MIAKITPSKAYGTICAPPSKSMAHRLLIGAMFSDRICHIQNIQYSEDIIATLNCIESLGGHISRNETDVFIKGFNIDEVQDGVILDCNESGSTLRFFAGISLALNKEITLKGTKKLLSRPLDVYEKICEEEGFLYKKGATTLTLKGLLGKDTYEIRGDISSQFITGLIFALSLKDTPSKIIIKEPIESKPYIDMTINVLEIYGVNAKMEGNVISLGGKSRYSPISIHVEGDYSQAAFFEALNYIDAKNDVEIKGLSDNSLQGDFVYKDFFETIAKGEVDIIDISQCPDLGPILFVVASVAKREITFVGTKRLAIKESDRASAMQEELGKFGIKVTINDDSVIINGKDFSVPKGELDSHNDHRIVMSLVILLTLTGGTIVGAEAVNKSFPNFFEYLQTLNVGVEIYED